MPKKLTQAEFLAKAVAVHGVGRYDYSQVVYNGNAKKVKILCPKHNLFEQIAFAHWNGQGCPTCYKERSRGPAPISASEKIASINLVHQGKYDYSLVPASFLAADKISVRCPQHGVFYPKYCNHLNGSGCPKCAGMGLSRAEWITRFRSVHGEKFDYKLLPDEITARGKISILCPAHGIFSQQASSHYNGRHGCLKCRHENKKINAGGWGKTRWQRVAEGRICTLYVVRFDGNGESFFKAGITSETIKRRFSRIANYAVKEIFKVESTNALAIWELEHQIKRRYKRLQYIPQQSFCGCRECYLEAKPIIDFAGTFPL
jgi:hypothetical protein